MRDERDVLDGRVEGARSHDIGDDGPLDLSLEAAVLLLPSLSLLQRADSATNAVALFQESKRDACSEEPRGASDENEVGHVELFG